MKHASPASPSVWPPPWLTDKQSTETTEQPAPPSPDPVPRPPEPSPPAADTRPFPRGNTPPVCRCGSCRTRDVPIHNGQSIRRDCAECGRFLAFIQWYGRLLNPSEN